MAKGSDRRPRGHRTIVSPHKSISVVAPQFPIDVLFRLLECDVHVAINGLKFPDSPISLAYIVGRMERFSYPYRPLPSWAWRWRAHRESHLETRRILALGGCAVLHSAVLNVWTFSETRCYRGLYASCSFFQTVRCRLDVSPYISHEWSSRGWARASQPHALQGLAYCINNTRTWDLTQHMSSRSLNKVSTLSSEAFWTQVTWFRTDILNLQKSYIKSRFLN
jgi:hypothetical protein